eukprot:sb/3478741/
MPNLTPWGNAPTVLGNSYEVHTRVMVAIPICGIRFTSFKYFFTSINAHVPVVESISRSYPLNCSSFCHIDVWSLDTTSKQVLLFHKLFSSCCNRHLKCC